VGLRSFGPEMTDAETIESQAQQIKALQEENLALRKCRDTQAEIAHRDWVRMTAQDRRNEALQARVDWLQAWKDAREAESTPEARAERHFK